MATYEPNTSMREAPLEPATTTLLFIDVQNYNCKRDGALFKGMPREKAEGPEHAYWWERLEQCTPRWRSLQAAFRASKAEVMYTVIQSLTRDGRDRSLDYKLSGFHVPPGCWDAQVIPELPLGEDEIVLPKTTSSVFGSTTIDYVLRNLGVKQLVLCGCVTDQCVEHAVRDACDAGYLVTLVTDACATMSQQRHDASLAAVHGYCRQRTTQQLCQELQQQQLKGGHR